MKRKIFAICSVLIAAIVLVAAVPGCTPTEPGPEATIEVEAIDLCDGQPWEGLVTYTLSSDGEDDVTGYEVPGSQTVAPGTWTLNVTVGGPPNSFVHNITPSATQTVAEDGTKTFTVEFDRGLDAEVTFVTWTINGVPVESSWAPIPVNLINIGDVIGIEYQQRVRGCAGINVTVEESSPLWIYHMTDWGQDWPLQGRLHVANNDCAVEKTPTYVEGARLEKLSQYPGVWDYYGIWECLSFNFSSDWLTTWFMPPPATYNWTTDWAMPSIQLNEATTYGLETGPLYDKTVNWLTFGFYDWVPEDCVLFQIVVDQPYTSVFMLLTEMYVTLLDGEDINPANNSWTGSDPPLMVVLVWPY